jgi:hypothetical protein
MDFRTQATIDALIESLGIRGSHILGMRGSFDRISVQGGAANFEQLQVHLATAKRLHDCHTAILTVHENCGAGAKREDLLTARRMAQELGYRCRLFFVKLNGQWDEVL